MSAFIKGLFGITPTKFGFAEVNIWPAIPANWADQPTTISITFPDGGFMKYTYLFRKEKKTVNFTIETDKHYQVHFRIPVPGFSKSIQSNKERAWCEIDKRADSKWELVFLDRTFIEATLKIDLE